MGWRYRRSVQLIPGVKVNVTKTGLGVTLGPRGMHYSIHSSGRRTVTFGLPETGLYWTQVSGPRDQTPHRSHAAAAVHAAARAGDARRLDDFTRPIPRSTRPESQHDDDPGLDSVAHALSVLLRMREHPVGEDTSRLVHELRAIYADPRLDEAIARLGFTDTWVTVDVVDGLTLTAPLGRTAAGLVLATDLAKAGQPGEALAVLAELPVSAVTLLLRAYVLQSEHRDVEVTALGDVDVIDDVSALYAILRAASLRATHRVDDAYDLLDEVDIYARTNPLDSAVAAAAALERAACLSATGRTAAAEQTLNDAFPDGHRPPFVEDGYAEATAAPTESAQHPEDAEAERLRSQLDSLRAEVVEAEVALVEVLSDIAEFAAEHTRRLSGLYRDIDQVNANIAAARAARTKAEADREAAEQAARTAQESKQAATEQQTVKPPMPEQVKHDLKSLFRALAKRVHPDLAVNEADRLERESLMKQVTTAYRDRDLDALIRLDEQTRHRVAPPDTTPGPDREPSRLQLEALVRDIAQVRRYLAGLAARFAAAYDSENGKLYAHARRRAAKGGDLLVDLETALKLELDALLLEYDEELRRAAELPENGGSDD